MGVATMFFLTFSIVVFIKHMQIPIVDLIKHKCFLLKASSRLCLNFNETNYVLEIYHKFLKC